jgi:hypothetical protein
VTEPSLLLFLGLSISTELLYTSTECPRCFDVEFPCPMRPLLGLLAPIIFWWCPWGEGDRIDLLKPAEELASSCR